MNKMTIVVLVIWGLGINALATGMEGQGKRGGFYKLLKQVNLTTEQKTEFKALKKSRKAMREEHKEASKSKRKEMMKNMQPNMADFMSGKTFDKVAFKKEMNKKFEAMNKAMKERKEAMMDSRANDMEKVFNILTPEQRVKLIELSKK
jgi:Spy/CpxP family protein refolding chaperone